MVCAIRSARSAGSAGAVGMVSMRKKPIPTACMMCTWASRSRSVRPQHDRQEQRLRGAEVQVDGPLADAGLAGDLVDGDLLVAPAHEQLGRGVEDPLHPRV